MGDPATQLVGLVVFLASDEASYIQGAVFSAKSTSDGRAGFIVSLKAHQPVRFASAAVNVKEVFLYESDRT